MLWDTHMHSQFSGDSHTPQEDMIAAAKQKNLKGICFTDHLDIDYPDEPETFLLDLPNYVSSVEAMQEKYKEILPVRLGIELGLQPHLAGIHADILSQYPVRQSPQMNPVADIFDRRTLHMLAYFRIQPDPRADPLTSCTVWIHIIRLIGKTTRRRKATGNILSRS